MTPTRMASIDASATSAGWASVGAGEREDCGCDHGAKRRVGPEDQYARWSQRCISDKAKDRGVEARDGRQPSQLGVGHPLGHQNGGEYQTGHQIFEQPSWLVSGDHPDSGHMLQHRKPPPSDLPIYFTRP